VELLNLDNAVGSILSEDDEIEVGEGKRLEALHILGNTSDVALCCDMVRMDMMRGEREV